MVLIYQVRDQNRQEKKFYLEFLVIFIHLDPETDWSKMKEDNNDQKDKNKIYAYVRSRFISPMLRCAYVSSRLRRLIMYQNMQNKIACKL